MTAKKTNRPGFRTFAFLIPIVLLSVGSLASNWFAYSGDWIAIRDIAMPMIVSVWASILGIAAASAWGRCGTKRAIVLIVLCLVAYLSSGVILLSPNFGGAGLGLGLDISGTGLAFSLTDAESVQEFLIATSFIALILALVIWVAIIAFRFLPPWTGRLGSNYMGITRKRFVIGLGVCFLILGVTSTVLNATDATYSYQLVLRLTFAAFLFALFASFMLAVFIPSWCLTQKCRLMTRLAVWGYLLVAVIAGVGVLEFNYGFLWWTQLYAASFVIGVVVYLVTLVGVGLDDQYLESCSSDSSKNSPSDSVQIKRPVRAPKFWIVIPLLGVVSLILLTRRYDTSLLSQLQYVVARDSGRLILATDGQIRRNRFGGYSCDFNESTPVDILDVLRGRDSDYWSVSHAFHLKGLHPGIDVSVIRDFRKNVNLLDSTISSGQLSSILCNANEISVSNCSLVDTSEPVPIEKATFVGFRKSSPGQVGAFLGVLESIPTACRFQIQLRMTTDDWPGIVKICQTNRLYYLPPFDDVSLDSVSGSLKNFIINEPRIEYSQSELTPRQIEILNKTDIFLQVKYPRLLSLASPYYQQLIWDVRFAFPGRISSSWRESAISIVRKYGIINASNRFHWVFGTDENEKITKLFLPNGDVDRAVLKLPELKILSFDGEWIESTRSSMRGASTVGGVNQLNHFAKLKHLEALYFSRMMGPIAGTAGVTDLGFLSSLKSLKHLQINSGLNRVPGAIGFESCPSLESITFFNEPDAIDLKQIKQLPSLKKVTILDLNDPVLDHVQLQQRLSTDLPGIEIVIRSPDDFAAEIPTSFNEHLKRLEGPLRSKLLAR